MQIPSRVALRSEAEFQGKGCGLEHALEDVRLITMLDAGSQQGRPTAGPA